MDKEDVFKLVLDCAFKVHSALGPGLLESAYEECLFYEIKKVGLKAEKQKALPLVYEDIKLDVGYRIDLLVENQIVIELKAVETLNEIHLAQVLTYFKTYKMQTWLTGQFQCETPERRN